MATKNKKPPISSTSGQQTHFSYHQNLPTLREICAKMDPATEKQSTPVSLRVTFDCGVQANFDISSNLSEILMKRLQQAKQKKKQKRRQYKRRKKIQKQTQQKSNNEQFKNIISSFYQSNENKFEPFKQRLEELVSSFNQNHFKNIFDQVLKDRVKVIQNSIWEYIQNVLHENPMKMENDHPFFYETIDLFYQYYKLIEKSSQQAEQVIYIYLDLNTKNPDQPNMPQNLGKKIFRYLIETDHSLKKLLKMCDRKISYVRYQQRLKLQVLFNQLRSSRQQQQDEITEQSEDENLMSETSDNYYESDDNSYEEEEKEYYEDGKSTAFSENSSECEDTRHPLEKKIKKKKINLNTLSQEDRLYYELQNLTIDIDNRLQCRLDEDDDQNSGQKYFKVPSKCYRKQNLFDELQNKLLSMPSCHKVSKQFKRTFEIK